MTVNSYSEFHNQNRSFARSVINMACSSASAIYLYDQSQSQPITILYQTGFTDRSINCFKREAYKYEPALTQMTPQNRRVTVNSSVAKANVRRDASTSYWALFANDGFRETLTSVERLSKNLSLVIGTALLERDVVKNRHLQTNQVLNIFDRWFDVATDFIIEDSVRRSFEGFAPTSNEDQFNHCLKKLTSRETQVLNLLTAGKINKQISHMLSISQYTVDNHLRNIYRKLGVRRRIELISKLNGMN